MHDKKLFQFEEACVKECGISSVSHWFLCQATVILVCRARGGEKDVYHIQAKCGAQVVEFFSAFVRLMKCLSSQENTMAVIYCVCMGCHSDLV